MRKKIIFLIIGLLLSVFAFATTWKYEGGLDGDSGIMIVYKTLPPLIVEVDEPELMVVPKGNQSFKYSDVTKGGKPLNVKIEIFFNNTVVEDNGINKEIIRTIYDTATLSFLNNGKFYLNRNAGEKLPRNNKNEIINVDRIDGNAIFTNQNAVIIGEGKIVTKKIGDSIQGGILSQSDIYIDAIFNSDQKEILSGNYGGSVTLQVEFLGKGVNQVGK